MVSILGSTAQGISRLLHWKWFTSSFFTTMTSPLSFCGVIQSLPAARFASSRWGSTLHLPALMATMGSGPWGANIFARCVGGAVTFAGAEALVRDWCRGRAAAESRAVRATAAVKVLRAFLRPQAP